MVTEKVEEMETGWVALLAVLWVALKVDLLVVSKAQRMVEVMVVV